MRNILRMQSAALLLATFLLSSASAQNAPICPREADNVHLTGEALRSVVLTVGRDPKVFENDNFSFSRTLASILATGFVPDQTSGVPVDKQLQLATSRSEQISLLASMLRTFRNLDRSNGTVRNNASFRPGEAELEAAVLLDPANPRGMRPIGLFNRLDLAPASWRYCGEHRVVYGMGDGSNRLDRFFLIFEAAVDNPDPGHSALGCLRIAEFWNSIPQKSESDRPAALANFYYKGDLGDGGPPITPVIHNQHFGLPFGQVRGNLFVTKNDPGTNPWMLREWRTFPTTDKSIAFVADTVKSNPNPEFYRDNTVLDSPKTGRTQAFIDQGVEFRESFLVSHVRELLEVDLEASVDGTTPGKDDVFNRLSALFEDKFNDFESISQSGDDPGKQDSAVFKSRIEREIKKLSLPAGSVITPDQVLTRASALSCAGCHQTAVGREVAPGVVWPASNGFTHIAETGTLSPTLLDSFLPARCDGMQKFIHDTQGAPPVTVSAPGETEIAIIRDDYAKIQGSEIQTVLAEGLADLSTNVTEARTQNAKAAGAFRRFRRTH
ncbi:hypothetical protein HB777_26155 [Mesorhizobium loti]|nr:hypothetical protein HB777_26155 [Mesorhizobium loti]